MQRHPSPRIASALAIGLLALTAPGCDWLSKLGGAPQPIPDDMTGNFTVAESANPGGGSYEGQTIISRRGDVWDVEWQLSNTPPYSGVGVRHGDVLGIGWGLGADYGVAVYDLKGTRLEGTWATKGSGDAPGTEVLEGPEGLDGVYDIVESTSPGGGKGYSGKVEIHPHGDVFDVTWTVGKSSYSGVGIKKADLLVVGWGDAGKGAGVVLYVKGDKKLDGVWSGPGETKVGKEVLELRG